MKHQEVCLNAYHISVKKMCASCTHKDIMNDGERVCKKMKLKVRQQFCCCHWQMSEVRQQFCCCHWQMSDGLKNAGLQNGGVVRLKGTQEIIIK